MTQSDDQRSHTDISHIVRQHDPIQDSPNTHDSSTLSDSTDAFDKESWGHPEAEPRPAPRENADHIEVHENVEHEPSPDVQGYIEHTDTDIELPEDLKELGVEKVDKPIQYPTQSTIKVPLTDEKILQGKKMPLDSSFRWLAEVCLYILHKAHIRLKDAHGKAERIMEKPS